MTHARSFKAWLQLPSRFSKANICKAISSVLPLRVPNFSLKLFFQIFYLNFISGENSSFFLPSLSLCTFSRSTIPRTVSSSHRGDRYFVFERNCCEEKEITPIDHCPSVAVHEFSLSWFFAFFPRRSIKGWSISRGFSPDKTSPCGLDRRSKREYRAVWRSLYSTCFEYYNLGLSVSILSRLSESIFGFQPDDFETRVVKLFHETSSRNILRVFWNFSSLILDPQCVNCR